MKTPFCSLRCPHCGSTEINLVSEDIFYCEYCKQKFAYELDKIDFYENNKVLALELKEVFETKVYELETERAIYKKIVVHYSNLANPRKLSYTFLSCAIISFFTMLVGQIPLLFCFFTILFSILYTLSKINDKKQYIKYSPYVSYYASKVVELEEKINIYIRLMSKLTK